MVRELDLKKPPSIAESIDWARALLLLGAEDIDEQTFRDDDVDHRQAPHRPRHRRRARRRAARARAARGVSLPAGIVGFAEALRAEGVAVGTSELLDAFAALGEVAWTERGPFREALAATLAKSPEDRRVFDLVFERFFFRAAEGAALEAGVREGDGEPSDGIDRRRADRLRRAARADRSRRSATATRPRCATSRGWRSPPSAAAARAPACSASTSSGSAARSACASEPGRARQGRRRAATELPLTRDQIRRFEQHLRRELERAQIERTQALPPSRPLNELDRALPSGPLQDLAAVHRVVDAAQAPARHPGPRGARARAPRARRRAPHDARVAADRRRARSCSSTARSARAAPSSTCSATSRTSVTSASRLLPVACCTRCTTRSASMRSFVFVERISEVTDVFERERVFKAVSRRDLQGRRRRRRLRLHRLRPRLARVPAPGRGRPAPARDGDRARRRAHQRPRPARRRLRRDRRARRPHVLAQPRAAAVLELRRLGDRAPTSRTARPTSAGRRASSRTS